MVLTIYPEEYQLMKMILLDKDKDEALQLINQLVARYETLMEQTSMGRRPKAPDFPKDGLARSVENNDPFLNFFSTMQARFPGNMKRTESSHSKKIQ